MIGAAFDTTDVVRLVAGARYQLAAPLTIPENCKLYVNGALINREMISTIAGGLIADDGPQYGYSLVEPSDVGALAWTRTTVIAIGYNAGGPAGLTVWLVKAAASGPCTTISYSIGVIGSTSMTNCYLGIYDLSGALLGTTADVSVQMSSGTSGKFSFALAGPVPLTAGVIYRIAMLIGPPGVTPLPRWLIGGYDVLGGLQLPGFAATGIPDPARWPAASVPGTYTALPDPLPDPATFTRINGLPIWVLG
jgi:hypothetical protein